MLKKLIKYDMRETYKVTVWMVALEILIFLICFAVIGWLKKGGMILLDAEDLATAMALIFTGFVALSSGGLIAETIYLFVHYYKTMHGDRAYLTRTLPLSTKQLLAGKVISISVFYSLVYIIWFIGYFFVYNQLVPVLVAPSEAVNAYEVASEASMIDINEMILGSALSGVVMIPCMVICGALSFALAQLLPKNKAFFGVVFYLCISWVMGLTVALIGAIGEVNAENVIFKMIPPVFITIIVFLAFGVYGFKMTCRLLDGKVDLE